MAGRQGSTGSPRRTAETSVWEEDERPESDRDLPLPWAPPLYRPSRENIPPTFHNWKMKCIQKSGEERWLSGSKVILLVSALNIGIRV